MREGHVDAEIHARSLPGRTGSSYCSVRGRTSVAGSNGERDVCRSEDVDGHLVCQHLWHERLEVERVRQVRLVARKGCERGGQERFQVVQGAAADANFASTHGGQSFAQFYGNSKNGKNAMGKCVSQAVQSTVAAQAKASKSALKSCKAAMKADKAAFATTYGSGKDALGKCVSTKSGTK